MSEVLRFLLQVLLSYFIIKMLIKLIVPKPIRQVFSKIGSKVINFLAYEFEFLCMYTVDQFKVLFSED